MFQIKAENGHAEITASGTPRELAIDAFQVFSNCCKTLYMSDANSFEAYLKAITMMILTGKMHEIAREQSGISDLKQTSIRMEVPESWYRNNKHNDTEGDENADD